MITTEQRLASTIRFRRQKLERLADAYAAALDRTAAILRHGRQPGAFARSTATGEQRPAMERCEAGW
jgi:hypothetical protein